MPVSPHWPHILQRRLQRFVTRSWTNVGLGTGADAGEARCAMTSRRPRLIRPRCLRAKPATWRPLRKLMTCASRLTPRVERDHPLDGAAADGAEPRVIAREH